MNKIGFACKLSEMHPKKGLISIPECNFGTTTLTWLNKQTKEHAVKKLWTLIEHNLQAAYNLVERVGNFEPGLRMVRMGSDTLPAYSHNDWNWFYKQSDVQHFLEKEFIKVGDLARTKNVRLSMHPGQFCCLVSENPGIVENSIEEFEYHVDMARWMGFGQKFQDFKINIHLSGKRGVEGFNEVYTRLSPEARNTMTLENDEYQAGLDVVLQLKDKVAIVLDLHHNWINTGKYIGADDDRVKMVVESWRGVRPVIHYSQSREDILVGHCLTTMPNLESLIASGFKKQKLRAHSDSMWNQATNDWAKSHCQWADVMVEAKHKNLASTSLFNQWKSSDI